MAGLTYANSFRELLVYQKARVLAREIFELSRRFPREEMYSLTDQIRRSSRSVGAQIAEAWAKRRYEKYFISKLTDTDGEQQETQHWIDTAVDCGYWTTETGKQLGDQCREIGRLLGGMINKANSFCVQLNALRESSADYLVDSDLSEFIASQPNLDSPTN